MSEMKTRHLLVPELDYELRIRGKVTSRDRTDKQKILGKLLQKEKGLAPKVLVDPDYRFDSEKKEINTTLDSIKNNIADFEGTTKDSLYLRTKSRLIHIQARIERMPIDISSADETIFKNEAIATFITLEADLDDKVKTEDVLPCTVDLSQTFAFNQPSSSSPYGFSNKSVPIYKWDLKFDGSKSGLGVKAFLERVEELSEARHVNKHMLYESAIDLFSGKALLWFRHLKVIVKVWETLISKLETDFLDIDYDETLWETIKCRKQQYDESVVVFVAIMESLFNRLSNKPATVTRIKWIKKTSS